MSADVETITKEIALKKRAGLRFIVAITGAPGAGKSTLAEALLGSLNQVNASLAAILPMDGFHLDNAILKARGILEKKGAPETFDIEGFASVLARIRSGDRDVIVPVFDRELDVARAGARLIKAATEVIIVEGNYLLLDRQEWAQPARNYDLTVFLDVLMVTLEQRLVKRWRDHDMDREAAILRAQGNDIPNAITVIEQSRKADIRIVTADPTTNSEWKVEKC